MKNLIEILKKETESLKVQYIQMTTDWSHKSFESMKNDDRFYLHTSGKYFQNRYGKTKTEDAQIRRIANLLNKGLDLYVVEMVKSAEFHYETSIEKLAARIESKGLDISRLKVETAHIGVNINTILTDSNKVVRAFTIIAEGEVQKPHYRYLIK